MSENATKWICCQLGAREHYALPRALHRRGVLRALVTEAWVRPSNWLGFARRGLRERFHAELGAADVRAFNVGSVAFELGAKLARNNGWPLIVERNRWFQRQALKKLKAETETDTQLSTLNSQLTLFAYSYAALEIFRWAKAQGWRTVLGQIDPGPQMGRVIGELRVRHGEGENQPDYGPPEEYWRLWREECMLADRIVVNSSWSRDCLVRENIYAEKIVVVPLAYEPPPSARDFKRTTPEQFTTNRPLRLLFLGQVAYLKGIIPLLEAMKRLREAPVELTVVGPELCDIPAPLRMHPNVRWVGPVVRGATSEFYQRADVFVFPSFCDGFGLTQLEAQAWQLPVIASRHCGDVIEDGVNGVLLPEVSSAAIASVLKELINDPLRMRRLVVRSGGDSKFSLDALATALGGL